MEIIILGLLMIKPGTIYEMKKFIDANLSSVCSSGTGSIQAVIKKFLGNGMISCSEYVENGVNKKVYELTSEGKNYFLDNLVKPMLYKEKNMELAKFFFMGFMPADKREALIDDYIRELETEKAKLERIRTNSPDVEAAISDYMEYLKANSAVKAFEDTFQSISAIEIARDIAAFQFASLELSIEKLDFEINWFKKFKERGKRIY